MFEYNFNAIQGLLDILNLFKLITMIDKEGLIHKLNNIDIAKLSLTKELANKLNASGIPDKSTLDIINLLSPSVISSLTSLINSLDITQLNNLKSILTQENIQLISTMISSLKCINILNEDLAINIPNISNINLVLNNLTNLNFTELLNINNILAFLGNLNIPLLQLEEFLNNQLTIDLQNINLASLSVNMPNFSSFTTLLNLSYLSGLFNLANGFCNMYLTDFFSQYNTLKTDLMTFLNTNISNFDLTELEASILQYNGMILNISLKLNEYTSMIDNLNPIIDQFENNLATYLTNNSLNSECANGIVSKLDSLKNFKTIIQRQYITPLTNQLNGLSIEKDKLTAGINSIKQLKFDLPSFNC